MSERSYNIPPEKGGTSVFNSHDNSRSSFENRYREVAKLEMQMPTRLDAFAATYPQEISRTI